MSSSAKRPGDSRLGKWPTPSNRTSRAPGMPSAIAFADAA